MKLTIGKQFSTHLQEGESKDEIDGKLYKEPKLETPAESEKQTIIYEQKLLKSELEHNKADVKISKETKPCGHSDIVTMSE